MTGRRDLPGLAARLLLLIAVVAGCGRRPERTLDVIAAEQESLPVLYLTRGGDEVVAAPALGDVVVEPTTRQLAFRAYVCTHPNCPDRDRRADGRPSLFIWEDPLWRIDDRGEPQYEVVPDRMAEIVRRGGTPEPTCPACRSRRDPSRETPAERGGYRERVAYYELPTSVARRRQLDQEYQERGGAGGTSGRAR